jgi:uncharacterized membrane protein
VYGQPAPGAYPPPPVYGQPAPGAYPPPPVYAPPSGFGQPEIGPAFSWGWAKFTQNVAPFMLAALIYSAVIAAVAVVFYVVIFAIAVGSSSSGSDSISTAGGIGMSFAYLVFFAALMLLSYFLQAGMINGSLHVAAGERVELGTFFKFRNIGGVIVASLVIGLATGIGFVLCVLPGIAFAIFAQFALFFVIDKGQGVMDAIRSSFALVKANFGVAILLYLVAALISSIGSSLCGVGLLVGLPLTMLITTYMYKTLQREPIAP